MKRGPNVGQILMAKHLTEMGIQFQEQVPVCEGRKWTWDFFLPGVRIAIEVDGMYAGRHAGWGHDYEKQNYGIMVQGVRVIRFTAREVERGKAREYLEDWFGVWENNETKAS
jgi:very-short-patch-repair endonuclease